jgi:hypothetical protein
LIGVIACIVSAVDHQGILPRSSPICFGAKGTTEIDAEALLELEIDGVDETRVVLWLADLVLLLVLLVTARGEVELVAVVMDPEVDVLVLTAESPLDAADGSELEVAEVSALFVLDNSLPPKMPPAVIALPRVCFR